ncbi:hypothetical protein [Algoriphagus persicinus]|uniref:hypothetical protein n=1 Tax=Algoriphagus persicinus TaxID=3108754 RepID=UPI002B3F035E|nr:MULTISPECIES: hypothetical protein [unclassified Algoriphagus]MEB2779593.1 hypothetical protein [Algoriphagus sp. C2-6-M1]MEB2786297.1 hypothetical protein [Algoriphagus sp. E1-3-M2]
MKKFLVFSGILISVFACQDGELQSPSISKDGFILERLNRINVEIKTVNNARQAGGIVNWMASINESLAAHSLQLGKIEYYGADGAGNTVFFNDRGNKQLDADFVPGDLRRGGFSDIAYALDGTEGATTSGLSQAQTDEAILRAMNTWDNISCSKGLELTSLGASPFDLGYVEALVTSGAEGSFFFTDIMHSGFNTTVADAVFGPGSNVLGVTFTFLWLDGIEPTDIDNNGKDDVAFRDIYYNDAFSWADGSNIDVETVVLHETGHGLSQAHFGELFLSEANDKFHFSPRAVMNAGYTGIQTNIGKTDQASHCSNWGAWPNN